MPPAPGVEWEERSCQCSSSLCSPRGTAARGTSHTGLPGPLGLWDQEGGACPRAPRFQKLKYLCENGTWFHSSGRKTAQASGVGNGGVVGALCTSDGCSPSLGSFDKSIGVIHLHDPSRVQALRRPGMATWHPLPSTALACQPGIPTPPPQTDPAMWRGRSAPRTPASLAPAYPPSLPTRGPGEGPQPGQLFPSLATRLPSSPGLCTPSTTCLPGPGA